MTNDELRKEVNAFLNPQSAAEPLPLPAGTPREKMNDAQQEVAFQNWVEHINARPSMTWTPEERNAIRVASARVLRELGH